MEAARVYISNVESRRLKQALESWGTTMSAFFRDGPGKCGVVFVLVA